MRCQHFGLRQPEKVAQMVKTHTCHCRSCGEDWQRLESEQLLWAEPAKEPPPLQADMQTLGILAWEQASKQPRQKALADDMHCLKLQDAIQPQSAAAVHKKARR